MAGVDPAEAFEERSRERDMIPLVTPYRQFTYGKIAAEWEHLNLPTDIRRREIMQMRTKFPNITAAGVGSEEKAILWEDAYSTEDLDPRREKSKSRALIPSIDPILPIYLAGDEAIRIHIPVNMASTAFYLNLLKGTFPPIVLKITHMIYNTSLEDTEARRELIKRLDHIYLIRRQLPRFQKQQFTHSMKPSSFDDFKRQCQSGIASARGCSNIPLDKLWAFKGFGNLRHAGTMTDDSIPSRLPQLKEVKRILLELEHITGQKLHRISGVPYPFQGGPEPRVWSWGILYRFLGPRLRVLRWACNKRWVTDLTVPILIVVLCYQVLERQRKMSEMQWPECQEFLRLPISLYQMHPLSVSIGKADHSRGMVSGFKSGSKLSLEDFDPVECNLLFETWSSNCAKSNFGADVDCIIKHFTETLRKEALPYWPADLAPLPPDGTIPQMQPPVVQSTKQKDHFSK
ncbi:Zinc finger protein 32 [Lasiodiplodia theobromae]|uniref:Zinc finger protein 32 n=1 Tax=Lasiodiplodia theobromae TaxID=45133 RepID=UPI0015C3E45D|nr:Zinc finger protein 32 [Lasiodiplodia theobromae]KAF4533900.1 Zinc finger protein 32 [Lasiodiplodia theobromae]